MAQRHHEFITKDSYIKKTVNRMDSDLKNKVNQTIRDYFNSSTVDKFINVVLAEVKQTVFTRQKYMVKKISIDKKLFQNRAQSEYNAERLRIKIDNAISNIK